MTTRAATPPSKFDLNKNCIFDLPAEVRDIVYRYYFQLFDGFEIHLIKEVTGEGGDKEHAHVSSVRHLPYWPEPILRRTAHGVFENLAAERHGHFTNLVRVSKAVYLEVRPHVEDLRNFTIIDSEHTYTAEEYHSNLRQIPQSLLANIKVLTLYGSLMFQNRTFWLTMAQRMLRLKRLEIVNTGEKEMQYLLEDLTRPTTYFMDPATKVIIKIEERSPGRRAPFKPLMRYKKDPTAPRLVLPPLDTLSLHVILHRAVQEIVGAYEAHGSHFKFVATDATLPITHYELVSEARWNTEIASRPVTK